VEKEEKRLCIQCGSGEVEDEKHFMLTCSRFREVRAEMVLGLQRRGYNWQGASPEEQLAVVMGGRDQQPGQLSNPVKKYVRKALHLRTPTD